MACDDDGVIAPVYPVEQKAKQYFIWVVLAFMLISCFFVFCCVYLRIYCIRKDWRGTELDAALTIEKMEEKIVDLINDSKANKHEAREKRFIRRKLIVRQEKKKK